MGGVGDQSPRGVEHGAGEVQALLDVHADRSALSNTERVKPNSGGGTRQSDIFIRRADRHMRRLEASGGEGRGQRPGDGRRRLST